MGVVRKTMSVGTLGVVKFRSKKEKLRRAERSRRDAEVALEREHSARAAAEERISAAEKRVLRALADAGQAAKQLDKSKKKQSKHQTKRRHRRAEKVSELLASAEPMVRTTFESARSASSDAGARGRKVCRRARKEAA